jgi:hypothetical protein
MALIPGTLPNDTCYGTPQDLLELFAQYLDVPAFALNSKVVFATASTGLTADVVWFDTTTATNPILKITVSGGFTDYIKNYITSAATVTIVGADSILILDASDSGNTKKGLVSDIVPAAGSITPAQLAQPFTRGTAVASTSGTAIDFTGIPSWAKRITVLFQGVSTSSTANIIVQLGTGAGPTFTTSGYVAGSSTAAGTFATGTTGFFAVNSVAASEVYSGQIVLFSLAGTDWISSNTVCNTGTGNTRTGGGHLALGATLTAVRITTTSTDTFDDGSVNIMYE